jgi:hypothetical protein
MPRLLFRTLLARRHWMVSMSSARDACKPYTLAQSPLALVQCCSHCSTVLVSLGPITVRLDVTALEGLFLTLGEAVERLHRPRAADTPTLAAVGARRGQS